MNVLEMAAALRARKVSSGELVSESLACIARRNPELNAFLTVTEESARSAARRADEELARGVDRGPLHGVPVALKDVFCTRGVRTTCGSKLFENFVPDYDAAVTEKLAAAGAVLVGKTGMHELAYGITSNNPHFGAIRNPCDISRVPGGSSGGSAAAVASGMVAVAMGSDTGGSIRIPAAFCGIVGLKPTSGRVSRYGVRPLDFSLDHMGPLTATVRDAAVVMNAIAGHDGRDDTSSRRPVEDYLPPQDVSIAGLRVGRPENFYMDRLEAGVAEAIETAFRRAEALGARVVPVRVPDIAAINVVGRILLMSEASAVMAPYWDRRGEMGPDVLALLDQGRLLAATDYINAQRLRRMMQREFGRIWGEVDVLFTPAAPIVAPRIGAATVEIEGAPEDVRMAATRFVRAINVLGLPAVSVPCGTAGDGLPVGLQIVGPAFGEAGVLRAAAALYQ
jgi:aspartyl-tRNA(Asn)/glutamyl-tRNA(Gln) amidotransferase subunit A